MVFEFQPDQEHETLSRSAIKQVDCILETLPTDEAQLAKACQCASGSGHGDCFCRVGPQLLEVVRPWLIYGTKDCGHVITHVAKQLFQHALRGGQFGSVAAQLIKTVHDEQVMKLREAKELKSKPHSIRRVVLNLVQSQFYSRPGAEGGARHHQTSINNVMFIGQLLVDDLLVDSAVHESLLELLRPRNRPDTVAHRLELACRLLAVAGPRLDQGSCMDPYYAHLERLMLAAELSPATHDLFGSVIANRAMVQTSEAREPRTA